MRKILLPVMTAALALSTTACEEARDVLGLKRVQMDEFEVMDRQPLSVPPHYKLRPPMPGEPARSDVQPAQQAKKALLGKKADNKKRSAGESHLLKKAKAENVDHSVRAQLEEELPAKEEAAPGESLAFWKDKSSNKPGEVIDPRAENVKYNGKEIG